MENTNEKKLLSDGEDRRIKFKDMNEEYLSSSLHDKLNSTIVFLVIYAYDKNVAKYTGSGFFISG